MNKPRVAFLGLGIMGSGMARRLVEAGFPVTVFNRSRTKAAPLEAAGAKVAATPAKAADAAEVVISMVSDENAARDVWLGPGGALAGAARGCICIESSTVTPTWVCELAANARTGGREFLDAPVMGSKGAAAAGELSFVVGGDSEILDQVRPLLLAMGKSIKLLGPIGSGARLKLVNNFMSGVQVSALAEAITWVERSGLDRTAALEVLTGGAPGSPMIKAVAPRMTTPDYQPNFPLRWMAKDLSYAVREAALHSLRLTTAETALALFERAISTGQGDKDMAAVIEPVRG